MLHTIQEAMKLTGVSRRTLYNHADAGRISYSVGPDGRRYFDTAELERAYGKLASVAHPHAQQVAQSFTPPPLPVELAQVIEDAVHRATAPLVAEIAELRATLMRIEHKPDTPATPHAASQPGQLSEPSLSPTGADPESVHISAHAPAVRSFADLLSSFE